MHNIIFFIIIIIPVTGFIVERYLDHLNNSMWSENLPEKLKGICDAEEYRKTQYYQKDNNKLSFWSSLLNLTVIVIMIISGGFIMIDNVLIPADINRLDEYFTVGDAAKYLGVSAATLRNWDKAGKLTAYRHPMNNYRLYKKKELEILLTSVTKNEQSNV